MLRLLDAKTRPYTLNGLLADQLKISELSGHVCTFYAITCFFDFEAAEGLAAGLLRAAKRSNVQLNGFHILYEAREWAKQRTDEQARVRDAIKQRLRLAGDDCCTLQPVSVGNELMHSKAYAMIDEGRQRGVVVTTSGNLTKRGLGIDANNRNNTEIAQVSYLAEDLKAFQEIFRDLSAMRIDEARVFAHNDLLFAVRLLSLGNFYHQWQGSLASEVRFTLKLSEEGKRRAREANHAFRLRGYHVERDSISRDPLGVEKIFRKVGKPFPEVFTRVFCVDTLLGQWVPAKVAQLMDCKLQQGVQPYMEKLKTMTVPSKLEIIGTKLQEDIEGMAELLQHVDQPRVCVEAWKAKARRLRDNSDLIQRLLYRFQRLEVPLAELERNLLSATYDSLYSSVKSKTARGRLKKALDRAIEVRRETECVAVFDELYLEAANRLFPEWFDEQANNT